MAITEKMWETLAILGSASVIPENGRYWYNADHLNTRVAAALWKRGYADRSVMVPRRSRRIRTSRGTAIISGWRRVYVDPQYMDRLDSGAYPEYAITPRGAALLAAFE